MLQIPIGNAAEALRPIYFAMGHLPMCSCFLHFRITISLSLAPLCRGLMVSSATLSCRAKALACALFHRIMPPPPYGVYFSSACCLLQWHRISSQSLSAIIAYYKERPVVVIVEMLKITLIHVQCNRVTQRGCFGTA